MKYPTGHEERIRADMIAEAIRLLRIIDADRTDEDTDESPTARDLRLRAQTLSRRLVAEMIVALRTPRPGSSATSSLAAVA